MNRNLRVLIVLAMTVATLALLSSHWQPVQAENAVFGLTAIPNSLSRSEATATEEVPTVDPPTEEPPTVPPPSATPSGEPPTKEPPTSTPKPKRTREGGDPPTAVPPTATLEATPEPTITPVPTDVVTPEPPESGGMMTPMSVIWIALLAGLGIVALGQFILAKIR